jgi:adenine deaminase
MGSLKGRVESSRAELVQVALGRQTCTSILHNTQIVNVYTREIEYGSVALLGDRIAATGDIRHIKSDANTEVYNLGGAYLVPGFMDPHIHIGDPTLPVAEFAKVLLERGTTSVCIDMCELYGIGGLPAVRWALDQARTAGLDALLTLPLHSLGAERLGSFRHVPVVEEFLEMSRWPQTIAVNEPSPHAVFAQHAGQLAVIEAMLARRGRIAGHAPALTGAELQAYMAVGASSDHEAVSAEEALERLRLGCYIMMRECAGSRDMQNILPLILQRPELARFVMVCSDDMQAWEFAEEGHVDHKLRKLVRLGLDPMTAIQMASINVAQHYGLTDDYGAIAPGRYADMAAFASIEDFRAPTVFSKGMLVARDGVRCAAALQSEIPPFLRSEVQLGEALGRAELAIQARAHSGKARVRVIGIRSGTLMSAALEAELDIDQGEVQASIAQDVLKIAVLDRHHGSGKIGKAFVNGFGLKRGAIATTYFWQHFSLLCVGSSDQEMLSAIDGLKAMGGGLIAVAEGRTLAAVPLPIGGILATTSLSVTCERMRAFTAACKQLGCTLEDPFLSLAFTSLPHIPHYGITDQGLYETDLARFVDVAIEPA